MIYEKIKSLNPSSEQILKLNQYNDVIYHQNIKPRSSSEPYKSQEVTWIISEFQAALEDDLNSPEALSVVFTMVTDFNRKFDSGDLKRLEASDILKFFKYDFQRIFGISIAPSEAVEIPNHVQALFDDRQKARQAKDFKRADVLRAQIDAGGFIIEDGKAGARLKRKS